MVSKMLNEDCQDYVSSTESTFGLTAVVLSRSATLAWLLFTAKMVKDKAEIRHPVFALVWQQVLFMLLCQGFATVGQAMHLAGVEVGQKTVKIGAVAGILAHQFHQMTWLSITCLR